MLGFCFPVVPVTSTSMLSLIMIRNGLRLKTVPRFTKITECFKTLLCYLSPPSLLSRSLLPPSSCRMPSGLRLLLTPGCPIQGRQLSTPGGWLAPLPLAGTTSVASDTPHSQPWLLPADHRYGVLGGRLNPLLLLLGMQEAEPHLAFLMQEGFAVAESIAAIFGPVNGIDYH